MRIALVIKSIGLYIIELENHPIEKMVLDFNKIGYIVNKSSMNRIGKLSDEMDKKYRLCYKRDNL